MTKPFESDIEYKDLSQESGKFMVELLNDLIYTDSVVGKIVVPRGFRTDLASIPSKVQSVISKVGAYDGAAIVHDWLYCIQIHERDTVDNVFLRIMKLSGVGFFTRYTMFWAVRLFAGPAWELSKSDILKYRGIIK